MPQEYSTTELRRLRVTIRVFPETNPYLHARLHKVPARDRCQVLVELSAHGASLVGDGNSAIALLEIGGETHTEAAPIDVVVDVRLSHAREAALLRCLAGIRQRDTSKKVAALANYALSVLKSQQSQVASSQGRPSLAPVDDRREEPPAPDPSQGVTANAESDVAQTVATKSEAFSHFHHKGRKALHAQS